MKKTKFKKFSTQIKECNKNGNLIMVDINNVNELICVKYKKICSSIVCLTERSGGVVNVIENND